MLSPSDFNNAVPQFTNGDYASNPINPQYIAEPDATNYNKGAEPLQTLPAQWWNWFINRFTNRFNKVNIYVKNIFNELSQLLSVVSESPSGTEAEPTEGQLKDMFETKYPNYLKTSTALSSTYVPQTTKVNGHALSGDVTVTCVACAGANGSGTAFGTAATVNTGTAVDCIPTVGTALGTTNGQFLATDANGKLKPSGYSASSFRSSSWTPAVVACANTGKNGNSYSAFGTNAFNSTAFTTCLGTVVKIKVGTAECSPDTNGVVSLPAYPSAPLIVCCAKCDGSGTAFGVAATKDVFTRTVVGDIGWSTAANRTKVVDVGAMAYWDGAYQGTSSNLRYYCGGAFGTAAKCSATAFRSSSWTPSCVECAGTLYTKPNGLCTPGSYDIDFYSGCRLSSGCIYEFKSCICGGNGYYYGNVCGNVCGTASCATNAGYATQACIAACGAGLYYCDNDLFYCIQGTYACSCCSNAISYGYICNKNNKPAIFTMPIPECMIPSTFCVCGYSNCTMCWYDRIEGPSPKSLVQIGGNSSMIICWYVCYNRIPSTSCIKIPYRLLGYAILT